MLNVFFQHLILCALTSARSPTSTTPCIAVYSLLVRLTPACAMTAAQVASTIQIDYTARVNSTATGNCTIHRSVVPSMLLAASDDVQICKRATTTQAREGEAMPYATQPSRWGANPSG